MKKEKTARVKNPIKAALLFIAVLILILSPMAAIGIFVSLGIIYVFAKGAVNFILESTKSLENLILLIIGIIFATIMMFFNQ